MIEYYQDQISKRKKNNQYRKFDSFIPISSTKIIKNGRELISFCSNDYFGLCHNKQITKNSQDIINKYGLGSGSSRFVNGNCNLYKIAEDKISSLKKTDDSIIFSSGYSCAIGILPALVKKGDLIVADKLIHSCLIDGAILSGAKLMRFNHNDYDHCSKILSENRNNYKKCLIISESVFSMDGDRSDIKLLLKLSQKFRSLLLIDHAHDLKMKDEISAENFLKMGTFSKACGSLGGYVTGNKILVDYLRNFSRSLIYTTALPPIILSSIINSIDFIQENNLEEKVFENVHYFTKIMNLPFRQSAIVPIIIGDEFKTLEIAKNIEKNGYLVSAIRPPTVEKNKSRLRITFNSDHKKEDIKELAYIIKNQI